MPAIFRHLTIFCHLADHTCRPPRAPSCLPTTGVFGQCKGLKTSKCHMPYEGFANDDIYYLEVCLFSQVPCQKPHA